MDRRKKRRCIKEGIKVWPVERNETMDNNNMCDFVLFVFILMPSNVCRVLWGLGRLQLMRFVCEQYIKWLYHRIYYEFVIIYVKQFKSVSNLKSKSLAYFVLQFKLHNVLEGLKLLLLRSIYVLLYVIICFVM